MSGTVAIYCVLPMNYWFCFGWNSEQKKKYATFGAKRRNALRSDSKNVLKRIETPILNWWMKAKCCEFLKGVFIFDFDIFNFVLVMDHSIPYFGRRSRSAKPTLFMSKLCKARAINVIDLQYIKNDLRVQRRARTSRKRQCCLGISKEDIVIATKMMPFHI